MKYELNLKYNGLSFVQGSGKDVISTDMPGNIDVAVKGEMSWIESLIFARMYAPVLKKLLSQV